MLDDYQHLKNDAFWAFIFSVHTRDAQRRKFFKRLLSIFTFFGNSQITFEDLLSTYAQRYLKPLELTELNALFCCFEPDMRTLFERCKGVFEVQNDLLYNVLENFSAYLETPRDIFNEEQKRIEKKVNNLKQMADNIFKILREERGSLAMEKILIMLNYTKDSRDLIGTLILYFNRSFLFKTDLDNQIYIHLKDPLNPNNKWPSELLSLKTLEMELLFKPSFPKYIDYAESDSKIFDVRLFHTQIPTDGIFLEFCELASLKICLKKELKRIWSEHTCLIDISATKMSQRLRPARLQKNAPCLVYYKEQLHRGIIVGQSLCYLRNNFYSSSSSINSEDDKIDSSSNTNNTQFGLVMVDFVDANILELIEPSNLYEIPGLLLGMPPVGHYVVLCYNTNREIEPLTNHKAKWESAYNFSTEIDTQIRAYFMCPAKECDYSGRRKSIVFKAQLELKNLETTLVIPEDWALKKS